MVWDKDELKKISGCVVGPSRYESTELIPFLGVEGFEERWSYLHVWKERILVAAETEFGPGLLSELCFHCRNLCQECGLRRVQTKKVTLLSGLFSFRLD